MILMDWTDKQQSRFDDLREHELAGTLTGTQRQELDALMVVLTEAADRALLPANTRLQQEQETLELRLQQRIRELEQEVSVLRQRIAMLTGDG
jgi:uncharacterized protein YceH (UPF0502 family)